MTELERALEYLKEYIDALSLGRDDIDKDNLKYTAHNRIVKRIGSVQTPSQESAQLLGYVILRSYVEGVVDGIIEKHDEVEYNRYCEERSAAEHDVD